MRGPATKSVKARALALIFSSDSGLNMEISVGKRRYPAIPADEIAPRALMANFSLFTHPAAFRYHGPAWTL